MEVQQQRGCGVAVAHRGDHVAHPARGGHPGGVAERDPVRAVGHHAVHDRGHPGRVDIALVRTAEAGGDDHLGGGAGVVQQRDQSGDVVEGLLGGPVHVVPVVGVRGGDDHLDLAETGVEGPPGAARVGHERRVAHARRLRRRGPDLVRVGHLRDRLRAHEADRLDPPDAGRRQRVEQAHLRRGGYGRLVLQPVPRADLTKGDHPIDHRILPTIPVS